MNQTELPFDARKLARSEDPGTSKDAARQCESLRKDHHRAILDALACCDRGANADELAARCSGIDRVQIGRRMHELEKAGLVRKTGEARPSKSGRMACCYAVTTTGSQQKELSA